MATSGQAAALLLARRGWSVVAVDRADVTAPGLVEAGVDVRTGHDAPVDGIDLVVKSPGVPGSARPVAAARARGIPIWSEIELAARELPNPLIGVTGTNGKTTTTELTAHLLRAAGIPAVACGNQGTALASLVDVVAPGDWLVVECSSFQLEDVHTFRPRAAVVLNVTPDHLDRHGDLDAYRDAKLRIFAAQRHADLAILPRGLSHRGGATPHYLDVGAPRQGAAASSLGGLTLPGLGRVIDWDEAPLRGRHNRENMMAAAALARHAGASAGGIRSGLLSFAGVPHRLEVVAEHDGVRFVNDSKATNPDAAIAALDAYADRVHLILGGQGKGTTFDALAAAARSATVMCYLVGDAAPEIARALDRAGVAHRAAGTLEAAVGLAAAAAASGDTVLLAPACASFDQFANYVERGERFRTAVEALAGVRDGP